MSNISNRMPLIDALKAIAALLVLLNHYSSYGPLAEAARAALPGLFGWFFEYGRMAVQVFLVIAGFLAARGPVGRRTGTERFAAAADLETLPAPCRALSRRHRPGHHGRRYRRPLDGR